MQSIRKIVILALVVFMAGCSQESAPSGGSAWSPSAIKKELADCKTSFLATNPNFAHEHADTYCNCAIPILTERFSPSEVRQESNRAIRDLKSDGSMQKCLDEAIAINNVDMTDSEAVAGAAERIAAKFVDKCELVLSNPDANPMDRDVCGCAAAGGITPTRHPNEFKAALKGCVREKLGVE